MSEHDTEIEQTESFGPDPIIIKPSRGSRIRKSIAARNRRRYVKSVREVHREKVEKDARDRYIAKKRLMRQKKRTRNAVR